MPDFDLDSAVKGEFDKLVGQMRAKRLSEEFPSKEEASESPEEEKKEDGEDLGALESMLNDYSDEKTNSGE